VGFKVNLGKQKRILYRITGSADGRRPHDFFGSMVLGSCSGRNGCRGLRHDEWVQWWRRWFGLGCRRLLDEPIDGVESISEPLAAFNVPEARLGARRCDPQNNDPIVGDARAAQDRLAKRRTVGDQMVGGQEEDQGLWINSLADGGRDRGDRGCAAAAGLEHEHATPTETRDAMADMIAADITAHGPLAVVALAVRMGTIVARERPDVVISTGAAPGFFSSAGFSTLTTFLRNSSRTSLKLLSSFFSFKEAGGASFFSAAISRVSLASIFMVISSINV